MNPDDFGGMPQDEFYLNESLYLEEEEERLRSEMEEEEGAFNVEENSKINK